MSTPNQVERLIELTQQNRLGWTYLYPEDPVVDSPGAFQSLTAPQAYVLEDEEYGFGLIMLKLSDPYEETNEPTLYVHGERVEASSADLSILVDTIRVFFEEVQSGTAPTMHDRIRKQVESVVGPFQQALTQQSALLERQFTFAERQLDVIDTMSQTALNASLSQMPAVPATEVSFELPINADTARLFLQELLGLDAATYSDTQINNAIQAVYGQIL